MRDIFRIILVGAGNIGSRHLQGLFNSRLPFVIEVVEPDAFNRGMAKERADAVINKGNILNVYYHQSLDDIVSGEADLVIVATNSDVRPAIVSEIIEKVRIRYLILEKVVFQSEQLFEKFSVLLAEKGIKTWVNCPRRLYPFYNALREKTSGRGLMTMRVAGGNWGLGCNGVHFIDLFAFLTGSDEIRYEYGRLDRLIMESKRKGFSEFSGSLGYSSEKGSLFLESWSHNNQPAVIDINTSSERWIISESAGALFYQENENKTYKSEEIKFPLQSELTGSVADEIITNGASRLAELSQSEIYHSLLFRPLLEHILQISGRMTDTCPVT